MITGPWGGEGLFFLDARCVLTKRLIAMFNTASIPKKYLC